MKTNIKCAIHEKGCEKTFILKEGDCAVVSQNTIVSTIKKFKQNTWGQHLVDSFTIRYVTFNGLLKLGANKKIIDGWRGLEAIKFSQATVIGKNVCSIYA